MTFGDADKEIRHLEAQLKFRDNQIQKLNAKCSLLQIEIEKLEDGVGSKRPVKKDKTIKSIQYESDDEGRKPRETLKTQNEKAIEPLGEETNIETIKEEAKIVKVERITISQEKLDELEAYASIIASLNHEVMQLIKAPHPYFPD